MKIEACLVCVDYADYLEHTLPRNKDYFDDIAIVTVDRDEETKKVCDDNGVRYVISDRLYEDDAKFNKGKALNDGWNTMSRSDWLCTFDADIILQDNFRDLIEKEELNPECIHGTKRLKIRYYDDFLLWEKGIDIKMSKKDPCYASGFFQLFNIGSSRITDRDAIYPEEITSALADIKFRSRWAEKWGEMSDEMIFLDTYITHVIHLPHHRHDLGDDVKCLRNWYGRKTLPFHMQTRPTKKKDESLDNIEDMFGD
jgi:hypothetical protein